MRKTVAIVLADGYEEIEVVVPADVLRRLGHEVLLVALDDSPPAGAHGIAVGTDCALDALDAASLDALVLPGGMPGAENLRNSQKLVSLVREMHGAGKIVSAICAAPIVLAEAGIMTGKVCTGYPMALVKNALSDASYTGNNAEVDGNIVTGKGPGAAFDFTVKVAEALGDSPKARQLMKEMFASLAK
ncbi:MAG: DJ-1/PfpI family protein [Victivallales bacterium]|nr:DJ-1/PfpI family protein [Victivallales bacterium]